MIGMAAVILMMRVALASAEERCELHPDLLARIRMDLSPWRATGISIQDTRAFAMDCPESKNDTHFCTNKMLRFSIDNGTLYFNSLIPRSKGD